MRAPGWKTAECDWIPLQQNMISQFYVEHWREVCEWSRAEQVTGPKSCKRFRSHHKSAQQQQANIQPLFVYDVILLDSGKKLLLEVSAGCLATTMTEAGRLFLPVHLFTLN